MIIRAQGILRHCFFGTYSAVIALEFSSEADAMAALDKLGKGWRIGKKTNYLIWSGTSEELAVLKDQLNPKAIPCNSFGCKNEIHEIDGIDHSIDIGPPFELTVEVENKDQLNLF